MAITLKYGNPATVALAGFAAGVGSRKRREQEDVLKLFQQQAQQGFQAYQAGLDREQRESLQAAAFAQQTAQAKLDRDFRQGQLGQELTFRADQANLERGFRQQQQADEFTFRGQEGALNRGAMLARDRQGAAIDFTTNAEEGLRKGTLAFPEGSVAPQKLKKLEEGRVAAMELDAAGQQDFMSQYYDKKAALLSMLQKAPEMSLEEDFAKNVYEQGGAKYQRLPGGKGFDLLSPAPKDTSLDMQKERDDAILKGYTKNLTLENPSLDAKPGQLMYAGKDGKVDENAALQAAIEEQDRVERGRARLAQMKAEQDRKPIPLNAPPLAAEGPPGYATKNPPLYPNAQAPAATAPVSAATGGLYGGQPAQATAATGVTLGGLSKDDRAMAETFLPRPQTAKDRPKSGTYIAPDGSIRWVQ